MFWVKHHISRHLKKRIKLFENTFVNSAKGDATNALVSLGYNQSQADKAVKAIYQNGMSSEDLIRDSLKAML